MRKLVLASTSVYRRELMARLGVVFEAVSPLYEERPLGLDPETTAQARARGKAYSLGESYPGALIVGSDQVLALGDEVLGKPGTFERACEQLERMSGRVHRLLTAVCVFDAQTGVCYEALDEHVMHMRELSRAAIERYVRRDEPYDCAGSYKWEASGVALFEAMEGADDTAIIGLPLLMLSELLRKAGLDVLAE